MRRKDREITDFSKMLEVLSSCDCCRLGLTDEGQAYIVPMNFGYTYENKTLKLYFHSAKEGRKIDILKRGGIVGFELDCGHELIEGNQACAYGYRFESVIGTGRVAFLNSEADKSVALSHLMRQQTGRDFVFTPEMACAVEVFCLTADTYTCKRHE